MGGGEHVDEALNASVNCEKYIPSCRSMDFLNSRISAAVTGPMSV